MAATIHVAASTSHAHTHVVDMPLSAALNRAAPAPAPSRRAQAVAALSELASAEESLERGIAELDAKLRVQEERARQLRALLCGRGYLRVSH